VPQPPAQLQHERAAGNNRALFASENHGQPAVAATPRPGGFHEPGVVAAHEAVERPGPQTEAARPQMEARAQQAEEHPAPQPVANRQAAPRPHAPGPAHAQAQPRPKGPPHPPKNRPHPSGEPR
jgi:hypothetical protein